MSVSRGTKVLRRGRQVNYPLPNLFVSMLQRLGLPADKFASSTGAGTG
jgi:hypothetical protein